MPPAPAIAGAKARAMTDSDLLEKLSAEANRSWQIVQEKRKHIELLEKALASEGIHTSDTSNSDSEMG